jgi:ABC-type Fe2+-enterobactin transport system substrate-binding protein
MSVIRNIAAGIIAIAAIITAPAIASAATSANAATTTVSGFSQLHTDDTPWGP